MPMREQTDQLPDQRRSVRADAVRPLESKDRFALGRRSDLAGVCQHLAQRRGAELRRERRSESAIGFPIIPFFQIKAQTATTYEIGTRGRRPDYTWDLALYRAEIQQRIAMPLQRVRQLQRHQCRSHHAPGHRSSGSARRSQSRCFVQRPDPGQDLAATSPTRSTISISRTIRYSATTNLPGAPRQYMRAELLYKHPSGFYFGPNVEWVPQAYFVDSANTMTTAPYAHLGAEARLRQRRTDLGLHRRPQSLEQGLHRQRQHHRRANPGSPLFEPGTGRAVYAGMRYRW